MLAIQILVMLLLGHNSAATAIDSVESGYEMVINHEPWWGYSMNDEEMGSSYRYFYPFFDHEDEPNSFHWHQPPIIKPPLPPMPPMPPMPSPEATREWPSWIPPIRLIKLPLDEPPADE
ncbi:hypothetical protein X975_06846, partial [Stegodyphus mimosarum]